MAACLHEGTCLGNEEGPFSRFPFTPAEDASLGRDLPIFFSTFSLFFAN